MDCAFDVSTGSSTEGTRVRTPQYGVDQSARGTKRDFCVSPDDEINEIDVPFIMICHTRFIKT